MRRDDREHDSRNPGRLLRFRPGRRNRSQRGGPSGYDAAFDQAAARFAAHRKLLERERVAAERVFGVLVEQPFERRRLLIDNSPRFQTWGLAERLIEEGQRHAGDRDGSSQLELMKTAVAVAGTLDARTYGRFRHRDLQATAWGHLGNALRVWGEYEDAERAFATSRRLLAGGTGDASERAQLASFEVSLLNTLARFEAAREAADRALAELPQGLDRLRVDLLLKRSMVETDPLEVIAGCREVIDLASASGWPQLTFSALQGMAMELAKLGRLDEGHDAVIRAGRLLHHTNPWAAAHLEWSAGCLALRGGEVTTAVGILSSVFLAISEREVFDGRLPIICHELVAARAAAGTRDEAARLAERLGDLLVSRSYPTPVLEGWNEVRNRLAVGRLSPATLTPFSSYFHRAWNDPRAKLVLPA